MIHAFLHPAPTFLHLFPVDLPSSSPMDPSALSSSITASAALALLSSARHSTSHPQTFLNGLDTLLHSASLPPLARGDVVELQSLPGAGKTSLLLALAATTLLPRYADVRFIDLKGGPGTVRIPVGGKEEVVAWVEGGSRRFPVEKLAALLKKHLRDAIQRYRAPKGLGAPKEEELDGLVEEALSRLAVFRCSSTVQMAVTVRDLPRWAAERARENGEDEPEVGVVVIEGLSEFAWADQWARESAAASHTSASSPPGLRYLLAAIAHLRRTLSPLIFLSQWVFRPSSISTSSSSTSEENLPFYTHHFGPPHWPSILSRSLPPSSSASSSSSTDPLAAPLVGEKSGGEKWESFPLALHITLHPPAKGVFAKGTRWEEVVKQRMGGEDDPITTEGIKCVVRVRGGREIGTWEMGIGEEEVST